MSMISGGKVKADVEGIMVVGDHGRLGRGIYEARREDLSGEGKGRKGHQTQVTDDMTFCVHWNYLRSFASEEGCSEGPRRFSSSARAMKT